MTEENAKPTRVITDEVRLSFVHLLKQRPLDAEEIESGQKPKYECQILIPKSDTATVKKIRAAIEAAKERDKAKWNGKIPSTLSDPLRDGDDDGDLEKYPYLEGHWFMNVRSDRRPGVVNRRMEPLTDDADVYSGMYAKVAIDGFGYNFKNMKKGITFGLLHVQKLRDGDVLGGGVTKIDDVFGAVDDDEDGEDLL